MRKNGFGKIISFGRGLLALLLAAGLLFQAAGAITEVPVAAVAAPEETHLKLACKSAVLMEQTTGTVLYEENADEALPIASVTKVMTLLLTMEALANGVVSLDEKVPVSERAASMGGSQVYLEPGEEITLDEVLKAVVVSSANDGAMALAELIAGSAEGFVEQMNRRAAELGAVNTTFFNPTGLDDAETNLSTARDVALISRELLRHEKITDYSTIWIDSIRNGAFGLSNTNKLIRFYPGATGLKTGSTAKAKYCVSASAERGGLKLVAVVLAGDSSAARWEAAKTLLDHGFANWAMVQPEEYNGAPVPVWSGTKKEVGTVCKQEGLLLKKSEAAGLISKTELAPSLSAPVAKGQEVGRVRFEKNGEEIASLPILAAEDVPRLSFSQIFRALLQNLFQKS